MFLWSIWHSVAINSVLSSRSHGQTLSFKSDPVTVPAQSGVPPEISDRDDETNASRSADLSAQRPHSGPKQGRITIVSEFHKLIAGLISNYMVATKPTMTAIPPPQQLERYG
jgi:hypothetical protein